MSVATSPTAVPLPGMFRRTTFDARTVEVLGDEVPHLDVMNIILRISSRHLRRVMTLPGKKKEPVGAVAFSRTGDPASGEFANAVLLKAFGNFRAQTRKAEIVGTQLRNANGVILQLGGAPVGVEISAAVGGVTVRLK